MKVIFLDRDNTINEDINGYTYKPKDIKIKPSVVEGLQLLKKFDFKFIIITNQSGIDRNYYTEEEFHIGNNYLIDCLKKYDIQILKTYYCSSFDNNCYHRKPNPGMIEEALNDFTIDINQSYIIGDKLRDIITGEKFPIAGVLINEGTEQVKKPKNLLGEATHFLEAALMITNSCSKLQFQNKILYKKKDVKKIQDLIYTIKHQHNEKITFTNGCFDIVHPGHLHYLQNISYLSRYLIVGLNSDSSVKQIKGNKRPIVSEAQRSYFLACLHFIDYIIIFDEDTPLPLLELIKPNYHVKGGDYIKADLPEYEFLKSIHADILICPFLEGYSTTNIIKLIQNNK